ncbi:endonuclease/exonuclease/phosphatase family protein [Bacillus aquiflavi]|uniref:Endonuclease/exonuclease/phosphatase family protein n=2 Tax=Bacillus aquiflavi TaxID=2672567 RepID=A0A6B3VZR3_9BACI|nr:endonuclease/exonuclease/phosphatase family protein [Bacillus aquiflavi]NEY82748.1 metal-dependent hydrolase [Bacillus aquiflavi]UAC50000.1 endonuclease/exonuclease/phosphatase family protein [Bacillus aquiflavi]
MTYNIHAGSGSDGTYDLERIAKVIEQSGADVIGLQEVDVHWGTRSDFENGIAKLSERLDMFAFFAPIYDLDPYQEDEPRRQFGVAVLSKYPIIYAKNQQMTRLSTQDTNPSPQLTPGFAEVKINAKGAIFPFYVTHLDYRSNPYVRELQVQDMLNIFSQLPGEKILVGDMNASPDAPELLPLFTHFNDVWILAGNGSPGFTFSALNPNKRIDYIFTTAGIKIENAQVLSTLASDHLPVIADVTLRRGTSNH